MIFHLVTTHQYGKGRSGDLTRLIDSIARQPNSNGCRIQLHCLVQGVAELPAELVSLQQLGRIDFSISQRFLSLSAARNRILVAREFAPDDILMFPDDDCYFPSGAFSFIADTLAVAEADLLFVPFSDPPVLPVSRDVHLRKPDIFDIMRRVGSCNLVVNAKLAKVVGEFDETLGLGATYPGGEDTDYAMRAWRSSRAGFMTSVPVVGHRSLNGDIRTRISGMSKYWPGLFIVTVRYFQPRLAGLLAYRLATGAYLVASGRLSFRLVLRTLHAAFPRLPHRAGKTPASLPRLALSTSQEAERPPGATSLP